MALPQVVFFDIGHTLASGAAESPRRLLAAALGLDARETRELGRRIMTEPAETPEELAEALLAVLPGHPAEKVRREVARIWRDQTECAAALPGAAATLRRLKQAGCRLGVISNIWHPFYRSFRERCPELHAWVDTFALSYRLGCKKPSLDLFRQALKAAGAAPTRCWMVGDSLELDVQPAAQLGIRTLWVLCRPERERALLVDLLQGRIPGPDAVTASIEEVAPRLLAEEREPCCSP